MGKIAVAMCSTSGVDYLDNKNEFHILRLTVFFDGHEYVDHIDIKADEFYKMMLDKPNAHIHTSQVSTGQFEDLYERVKNEGYTDLLVITLSSKLSGTYQGAILAKELVTGLNIAVLDSKSVSYGEALLGLKALELIKQGYDLDSIVKTLESYREKLKLYVLVDTLKYLVKNGRLSATAGLLGTLLKIKPLLMIKPDGTLAPFEKIRTTSKAQKRLIELITKETQGKQVELFIVYTTNKDRAEEVRSELQQALGGIDIKLLPLTPVVGAHAGPGTMGIGYVVL
jgi:DegV family protein with EDD domain